MHLASFQRAKWIINFWKLKEFKTNKLLQGRKFHHSDRDIQKLADHFTRFQIVIQRAIHEREHIAYLIEYPQTHHQAFILQIY
jgi:hypothetical protein